MALTAVDEIHAEISVACTTDYQVTPSLRHQVLFQ